MPGCPCCGSTAFIVKRRYVGQRHTMAGRPEKVHLVACIVCVAEARRQFKTLNGSTEVEGGSLSSRVAAQLAGVMS